ncbi:MAG: UDP-N-acetylmuramate dehydrogenase [Acidimicrobiales bacterium]
MNAPTSSPATIALGAALQAALQSSDVRQDVDIGRLTTYRVGGSASVYVRVESSEDLLALVAVSKEFDAEVAVVGRGSNLLVADDGFPGLVVQLGDEFSSIDTSEAPLVRLGGAASLPAAARQLSALGLTGFEWAVGVPGSVGGAIRMNAGGHGSDMSQCVSRARIVNLATAVSDDRDLSALAFGYRSSSVLPHELVIEAEIRLHRGSREDSERQLTEIVAWRRENQPGGHNAGSVFTNPEGDSAGRLIEASGLKGVRVGSASVSTKHANFIQSDDHGRAEDILQLMLLVIERVEQESGVLLAPETRFLGFSEADLERLHPWHR